MKGLEFALSSLGSVSVHLGLMQGLLLICNAHTQGLQTLNSEWQGGIEVTPMLSNGVKFCVSGKIS